MDLAAVWTVAALAVVEAGAGLGDFVLGHMTVMAEFIFTTASLLHEGQPRMAGLEVTVGSSARVAWLPSDGAMECTI